MRRPLAGGRGREMAPPWVKDRSACYKDAALHCLLSLGFTTYAAVTLDVDCVGIPALLQGTMKLRRSAAARRLTAASEGEG